MVNEHQSNSTSVEITAFPIAPEQTCNDSRDNEGRDQHDVQIVSVLPAGDVVLLQITDIRNTRFASRFQHNPTNVGVQQSFVGVIGVKIGVGISVVSAVTSRPPSNGALGSTCSSESEEVLQRSRRVV